MTTTMQTIFGRPKALIGMIHVRALPGVPQSNQTLEEISAIAAHEAALLASAGFDGAIIENMHDRPYVMNVGPETVAAMTRIGLAVKDAAPQLTLGVQVLSLSGKQTLAIATSINAQFVRIENFAMAHVADEGLMATAEAGELLRYRRAINAESVAIFADIKKKHASHAITADISLTEAAKTSEFFLADGLVVSGASTGAPVAERDLLEVRNATHLPVLVGSGATPEQLPALLEHADGVIVGSSLKQNGVWSGDLDSARCHAIASAFKEAIR